MGRLRQTYIALCTTLEFADEKMREQGYRVWKIGMAYEPYNRLEHMSKDKLCEYYGEKFLLLATFPLNIENTLHRNFNGRRVDWGMARELFYFTNDEMKEIVKSYGFRYVPCGEVLYKSLAELQPRTKRA